jgi:hypothetical protein
MAEIWFAICEVLQPRRSFHILPGTVHVDFHCSSSRTIAAWPSLQPESDRAQTVIWRQSLARQNNDRAEPRPSSTRFGVRCQSR